MCYRNLNASLNTLTGERIINNLINLRNLVGLHMSHVVRCFWSLTKIKPPEIVRITAGKTGVGHRLDSSIDCIRLDWVRNLLPPFVMLFCRTNAKTAIIETAECVIL